MAELGPTNVYGDLVTHDDFYVKGSKGIHINDADTRIWEDDDSNMTFKDAIAGTYTLQELASPEHNLLRGLQGGESNDDPSISEYYHLEYDQYKALLMVIGGPSVDADDYHTHSMISEHNLMNGLQGGNDEEYYHMTDIEYNTYFVNLTDGSNADALHSHTGLGDAHNDLEGLQGGREDEYYHLTEDQFYTLIGGPSVGADEYHTHSVEHNDTGGLQGGDITQRFHLTFAQWLEINVFFNNTDITGAEAETLTDGSNADALHSHTGLLGVHNNLEGLQGGEEDKYYHLNDDQYYGLIGGPSVNADEYHTHSLGGSATMPTIKYIYSKAFDCDTIKSINDSSNWGVNEAIIKIIKVETSSTDWDLTLFCDPDEESGMFASLEVVKRASGTQVLSVEIPYIDNTSSGSIHFTFTEHADPSSGGGVIDIYGVEATV